MWLEEETVWQTVALSVPVLTAMYPGALTCYIRIGAVLVYCMRAAECRHDRATARARAVNYEYRTDYMYYAGYRYRVPVP